MGSSGPSRGAGPEHPPDRAVVTFPAHLSFLATVRASVGAVVAEFGGDLSCDHDLQLAADEAAAVLIADATTWSTIHLMATYDDTDIYVRMAATRALPSTALRIDVLSRMLLDATAESHDITSDGDETYAVIQRRLSGTGPAS